MGAGAAAESVICAATVSFRHSSCRRCCRAAQPQRDLASLHRGGQLQKPFVASHASNYFRMHLTVRHTINTLHSHRITHCTSYRHCEDARAHANYALSRSAQVITHDYGCAACTTSRYGEANCTCTQKVRCLECASFAVAAGCVWCFTRLSCVLC